MRRWSEVQTSPANSERPGDVYLPLRLVMSQEPQRPDTDAPQHRHLSIQRCIQSLVHACQCRNANCSQPSCQKMKRVVQHTKRCRRKTNGGCSVCKQLIALCCYHAKHCQENKCPVPFCLNIKHKLHQQQQRQRQRQQQHLSPAGPDDAPPHGLHAGAVRADPRVAPPVATGGDSRASARSRACTRSRTSARAQTSISSRTRSQTRNQQ
ncbi:uncharacterized protein LOC143485715 isoform X2 [Brachyhypopomus gauderio]|uniref:uncharacterized protein LOC143485715 isoform X2 n=1 Tax=Brachyhypopomus gauderio TaxID=698409 RepID=UPI004041BC7A